MSTHAEKQQHNERQHIATIAQALIVRHTATLAETVAHGDPLSRLDGHLRRGRDSDRHEEVRVGRFRSPAITALR